MSKPTVSTKCPANHYTGPRERIIEFSSDIRGADGQAVGGLISFRATDDGRLRVEVYRCDPEVDVIVPDKESTGG